jgi:hypothetical protein
MRKVIGWPVAWGLFWLGDLVSKPMERFDLWMLYSTYNWLMGRSYAVSEWAGLEVWKSAT